MRTLFGIPIDTVTLVLVVAFAAAAVIVAVVAFRNRVFLRLGTRNFGRRRSRTALILMGLMLGTALISAALNTGDTLAHTVRAAAITSLGKTDELVVVKGAPTGELRAGAVVEYFGQDKVPAVQDAATGSGLVAGAAPAILETVAVQDTTSRQTEAQVGLFASDPASLDAFGAMSGASGQVSLAGLGDGELYLNTKAADKLGAHTGDDVQVFAGSSLLAMRVKDIVSYQGTGTDGAAVLMPLSSAQQLVGKAGQVNFVMIANRGGVARTDDVVAALQPHLDPLGLEIKPTKQDALDDADRIGNDMMATFTTFGTFSIVAGILLIFLIFVMLAAERKTEMGISRALGTQRGNLVQMFLFEGVIYDVAAAAIGALLGVAVAYVMVIVMSFALASFGIDLKHDLRPQTLIVAYTIGVLLTLIVVTVSAWQVSVLNIVRAIRNLPEPVARRGGGGRFLLAAVAWLVAVLLVYAGISGRQAAPFNLGAALAIIGAIPFLRALRVPERVAYTAPALALTVWFLLPFFVVESFLPPLSKDFTIFVLGGLMVVTGATWLIMYNSDLILRGAMALFGRVRWLAPMLRTAVAYPLSSRFRTGITLAMFTLVVFTLVVMATTINSVNGLFDDQDAFSGGYDVRAMTAPISPIDDLGAAAGQAGLNPADFDKIASGSILPLKVRQVGASDTTFRDYLVRGFDDAFLRDNQYQFALMAPQYRSARDVWQALAANPDLAVVDGYVVPRRTDYGAGFGGFDFRLSGFYMEDNRLPPVQIEVDDPQTGSSRTLTVIGVLRDTASAIMTLGISTSQQSAVAAYGDRAPPTTHLIKLAPGVGAKSTATALESAFLANGMQATATKQDLNDVMATQHAFTYIIEGFMGLGLLVGVAALGVISARSVVERRQEIGVLRSLGFQRSMVQSAFLLESSFISLLGIGLGTVLGLIISFNVVLDFRNTPGWGSAAFSVPWLSLAVVFLVVYLGAVFATLLPARQASRTYPAAALRYE